MGKLVTPPEAAILLRVSLATIRSWTFQKKLPVIKMGRKCLYREDDLLNLINQNYHPGAYTKK